MSDRPEAPGSLSDHPVAGVREPAPRYRTLDAWRGFACILLVIYHSTMHVDARAELGAKGWNQLGSWLVAATKHLNVGVPIFFVISGYCIMATLDARRRNGEGVGVFFWRRFHRIYPPYWLALIVSSVVIWLVERFVWPGLLTRAVFKINSPTSLNLTEWLGNLTLTESWRSHLTGGRDRFLIGHAWTLCYEEQFYAVAGVILFLAPRRLFLAALFVTLSVPFLGGWAHRNGIHLDGTIIGGYWFYFAAGIAAFYRIHSAGRVGRSIISLLICVAMFLPALDSRHLLFPDSNLRFSWIMAMLFAFLLSALHQSDAQLSTWRMLRPFSYCGKICYSLYLIHPLVTTGIGHAFYQWGLRGNWETLLVTLPVSFVLSLATGVAFFNLVERHFLNSPDQKPTDNAVLANSSIRLGEQTT